ncbi:MAG: prolipoprotein diacylglyceryl transferase [Proteobacteria bacterium]|nr:prolipoprotein diacylglyceryl transferase [Pseudomonadota bacterium]
MQGAQCIVWDIDPVMFKLWFFAPRWYGLFFGLGLITGYYLFVWQSKRTKLNEDIPIKLFFYIYFGTIIGAFLGHRLFYDFDKFIRDPISGLSLKGGISGLSSHGAAVGIIIGVFLFSRKYKIRFLEIFDRISFGIAVVAASVRAGNLMNSEIVGRQTDVSWAFCFPRYDTGLLVPRHPSQIYEVTIGLLVLFSLIVADRLWKGENRPLGFLSGLFAIQYFSLRFVVEFFKEYQALPSGYPLTMGQFLSIPFVVLGLVVMIWSLITKHPASLVPEPAMKGASNPSRKKASQRKTS